MVAELVVAPPSRVAVPLLSKTTHVPASAHEIAVRVGPLDPPPEDTPVVLPVTGLNWISPPAASMAAHVGGLGPGDGHDTPVNGLRLASTECGAGLPGVPGAKVTSLPA